MPRRNLVPPRRRRDLTLDGASPRVAISAVLLGQGARFPSQHRVMRLKELLAVN